MFQIESSWFQVDTWIVIVVIICVVAFLAFAVQRSIQAHRHQVSAGREDLIGKTGEVRTALKPKGMVFIEGENWTAISEKGHIEAGEEVIVSRVDNLKLWVTKK